MSSILIDEKLLLGTWEGGADDGSGLRTMIYNYGITFKNNGVGESFSWDTENKKYQETKDSIEWKLSVNGVLHIRYMDGDKDSQDWDSIEIEISDFIGAYNSQHYKLVDKGCDTFWIFPEPLYKSKYNSEKEGLLNRIWKKLMN